MMKERHGINQVPRVVIGLNIIENFETSLNWSA